MPNRIHNREGLSPEPFWYKSGVIYQLRGRACYDSNSDGTGDFRGLTEKLNYISELGATAIWLLPLYPSPLRDDGYDIADGRTRARAECGVEPLGTSAEGHSRGDVQPGDHHGTIHPS